MFLLKICLHSSCELWTSLKDMLLILTSMFHHSLKRCQWLARRLWCYARDYLTPGICSFIMTVCYGEIDVISRQNHSSRVMIYVNHPKGETPMMTSSNGNIFRVTGSLCGEIPGHPVNSPHRGQWRGALMFSLIYAWRNGWVNSRDAGYLRRYCAYNDVTVMLSTWVTSSKQCINVYDTCTSAVLTGFLVTQEVVQLLWCLQAQQSTPHVNAKLPVFFPRQAMSVVIIETPKSLVTVCEGRWAWIWVNNAYKHVSLNT